MLYCSFLLILIPGVIFSFPTFVQLFHTFSPLHFLSRPYTLLQTRFTSVLAPSAALSHLPTVSCSTHPSFAFSSYPFPAPHLPLAKLPSHSTWKISFPLLSHILPILSGTAVNSPAIYPTNSSPTVMLFFPFPSHSSYISLFILSRDSPFPSHKAYN